MKNNDAGLRSKGLHCRFTVELWITKLTVITHFLRGQIIGSPEVIVTLHD